MQPILKCASGMMADVRVLDDESVKPFESLEGAGRMGLDLAKYMAEHVYMYSSVNARCRFRVARAMIERAMWQFAKNFAPDVLILEPKRLVDQACAEAERTLAAYKELEG